MSALSTSQPAVQRKSWFARNWWWLLPLAIGVPLLVVMSVIAGFFLMFMTIFTSSQPYQDAMAMARQDRMIQQQLGSPIEAGWFVTGNLATSGLGSNATGQADLQIPLSGPNGSGDLAVYAQKQAGIWHLREVTFYPHGHGGEHHLLKTTAAPMNTTQRPHGP